jgi:hypothetical protein
VLLQVAPAAPENGHVRGVECAFARVRATLRSPHLRHKLFHCHNVKV